MATSVKITDNSQQVIEEMKKKKRIICEALGIEASGNAISEINSLVYDQPIGKSGYIRTGRLKNGIAWASHDDNGVAEGASPQDPNDVKPHGTPKVGEVYIGTNVEYAEYVEAGTSKMASRPFLRNAVEHYIDDYKNIVEDGLKSL